jgi:hypothetical protein
MKGRGRSIRKRRINMAGFPSTCGAWKQSYHSKSRTIDVARHQEETTGATLRVYPCGDHWHITSKI